MAAGSFRSSILRDSDTLIDVEPLDLSETSALDNLEFALGAEDDKSERSFAFANLGTASERIFANSNASSELDSLLRDSRGSADMDFDFGSLTYSLNADVDGMAIVHEDENKAEQVAATTTPTSRQSGSYRIARPGQCLHESWPEQRYDHQRYQIDDVNFDPPLEMQLEQHNHDHKPTRQASLGDLTAYSTSIMNQPLSTLTNEQYADALQKLADSMKRSNESRKHVMMQRTMLTPAQRQALSSAKEQLNRGVQPQPQISLRQGVATQNMSVSSAPLSNSSSSSRSSIMAAFFSGSRGTLTNGLEQSRKQLEMYMGSMQNQTF